MHKEDNTMLVSDVMLDFAMSTGLADPDRSPRRYLWTDAFAVCNFVELYRRSQDQSWLELARQLVDQVHGVLGRHRGDGEKSGWLSGMDEQEGELHPTIGGLRIGKPLAERLPDEPMDERLEWDRDGQYYHYLTKWMHALSCMARVTGDVTYLRWAMELARTAHRAFRYAATPDGLPALHWKMSVDLKRPLVRSAGLHDPLDGLVACSEMRSLAGDFAVDGLPDLGEEMGELASMCRGKSLATDDPLGIGGLLCDANWMELLVIKGDFQHLRLFRQVLDDALASLEGAGDAFLELPARYRLAFRELGLSIGLRGAANLARLAVEFQEDHDPDLLFELAPRIEALTRHLALAPRIERFWRGERDKGSEHWKEHRDINMVMLATSLAPGEFLQAG
jgi:hypothetical protein